MDVIFQFVLAMDGFTYITNSIPNDPPRSFSRESGLYRVTFFRVLALGAPPDYAAPDPNLTYLYVDGAVLIFRAYTGWAIFLIQNRHPAYNQLLSLCQQWPEGYPLKMEVHRLCDPKTRFSNSSPFPQQTATSPTMR